MSEQGNYNVLVEVKKTTIWLRKKDAEKPIDGRIKNQGVIMIENKIILIEDDKEIRGMINDYLSERIYHFNFYREFFDLIDSAPEEYELDYNQLLSIATLDTVFYTDKLPEIS